MREFKATLPASIKGIDGKSVTGICAVFGNIDAVQDRLHPGCFAKTIMEAGRMAKHLWNHDWDEPPTAFIDKLEEVGRDALPSDVLALAPEATGGLQVTRTYLETERASEVLEGIKKKAINQMSFAFDPIKADYTKEGDGPDYLTMVRELREVRLYDTSDVNWGCNDATVASKAFKGLPLEAILQNLALHVRASAKSEDQKRSINPQLLNALVKAAMDLGWSPDLDGAPIVPTEEQTGSRAEAHQPSLTKSSLALKDLQLSTLE